MISLLAFALLADGLPSPTKDEAWPVFITLAAIAVMVERGYSIMVKRRQLTQGTAAEPHHIAQPVKVEGQMTTSPAISHATEDDLSELSDDVRDIKAEIGEMKEAAVQRVADIRLAFKEEATKLSKEIQSSIKQDFKEAYQRINEHGEKLAAHEKQLEMLAKAWRS
jgi:hypothetical protein